jgi:hypothetical protein
MIFLLKLFMVAAESPEHSDAIGISVPRQLALSG